MDTDDTDGVCIEAGFMTKVTSDPNSHLIEERTCAAGFPMISKLLPDLSVSPAYLAPDVTAGEDSAGEGAHWDEAHAAGGCSAIVWHWRAAAALPLLTLCDQPRTWTCLLTRVLALSKARRWQGGAQPRVRGEGCDHTHPVTSAAAVCRN